MCVSGNPSFRNVMSAFPSPASSNSSDTGAFGRFQKCNCSDRAANETASSHLRHGESKASRELLMFEMNVSNRNCLNSQAETMCRCLTVCAFQEPLASRMAEMFNPIRSTKSTSSLLGWEIILKQDCTNGAELTTNTRRDASRYAAGQSLFSLLRLIPL